MQQCQRCVFLGCRPRNDPRQQFIHTHARAHTHTVVTAGNAEVKREESALMRVAIYTWSLLQPSLLARWSKGSRNRSGAQVFHAAKGDSGTRCFHILVVKVYVGCWHGGSRFMTLICDLQRKPQGSNLVRTSCTSPTA